MALVQRKSELQRALTLYEVSTSGESSKKGLDDQSCTRTPFLKNWNCAAPLAQPPSIDELTALTRIAWPWIARRLKLSRVRLLALVTFTLTVVPVSAPFDGSQVAGLAAVGQLGVGEILTQVPGETQSALVAQLTVGLLLQASCRSGMGTVCFSMAPVMATSSI